LVIASHILKRLAGYEALGGDYFERQSTKASPRTFDPQAGEARVKSGSRANGLSGLAPTPDSHSRALEPDEFGLAHLSIAEFSL
jgi:hypothetical protein